MESIAQEEQNLYLTLVKVLGDQVLDLVLALCLDLVVLEPAPDLVVLEQAPALGWDLEGLVLLDLVQTPDLVHCCNC